MSASGFNLFLEQLLQSLITLKFIERGGGGGLLCLAWSSFFPQFFSVVSFSLHVPCSFMQELCRPSLSLLYIRMVGFWKSVSNISALSFNTVYCKVAALLQRKGSHPSSAFNKQLILSWCGSIRTEETVCMGRNSGLSHLTTGTPDTLMNTHAFSDVCTKPNTPSTQIHTRPCSSKSN